MVPNSKLSDLKNKVMITLHATTARSTPTITNLTRVEVLTSLLYKTAVEADTKKRGCFKTYYLTIPVDICKIFVQKLPQTPLGNFWTNMMVTTRYVYETSVSVVVTEIKKEKVNIERVQIVRQAAERFKLSPVKLGNEFDHMWVSI